MAPCSLGLIAKTNQYFAVSTCKINFLFSRANRLHRCTIYYIYYYMYYSALYKIRLFLL